MYRDGYNVNDYYNNNAPPEAVSELKAVRVRTHELREEGQAKDVRGAG